MESWGVGVSAGKHTAGPLRAAFTVLGLHGFDIREVWLGDYFDGLLAVQEVAGKRIEIYAGNADDGDDGGDRFYPPVVYIGDRVEINAESLSTLARAAIATATGAEADPQPIPVGEAVDSDFGVFLEAL